MRKQAKQGVEPRREAIGLIMGVMALFLVVVFGFSASFTGPMGTWVRRVCQGLLGPLAYCLPVFLLVASCFCWFPDRLQPYRGRLAHLLAVLCILTALGHLFTIRQSAWVTLQGLGATEPSASKFLVQLFQVSGSRASYPAFSSSYPAGLLLGLPITGLDALMGKVGAVLFAILALLLEGMQLFDWSWSRLLARLSRILGERRNRVRSAMLERGTAPTLAQEKEEAFVGQMSANPLPAPEEDTPSWVQLHLDESSRQSSYPNEDVVPASTSHPVESAWRSAGQEMRIPRNELLRSEKLRQEPAEAQVDRFTFPKPMKDSKHRTSARSGFTPATEEGVAEESPSVRPVHVEPINPSGFNLPSFLRKKEKPEEAASRSFPEAIVETETEEEFIKPVHISDILTPPLEERLMRRDSERAEGSVASVRSIPFGAAEGSEEELLSWNEVSIEDPSDMTETSSPSDCLGGTLVLEPEEQGEEEGTDLPFSVEHPGTFSETSRFVDREGGEIHVVAEEQFVRSSTSNTYPTAEATDLERKVEEDWEEERPYQFPPLSLLNPEKATTSEISKHEKIRGMAERLETTLKSFGVDAKVMHVSYGPAITRFELAPAPGVKVSKILNLADDIALSLAALSVRIEAPIPGKSAIGIEIPNAEIQTVGLREILEDPKFTQSTAPLLVGLGRDIPGQPVLCDLRKMPHLLIAGATGSGKSVCINCILMSILFHAHPDDVKLLMVDPKVVELKIFNGIPHLLAPVVTDPKKAANMLNWAVNEMDRRYRMFSDANVRDYNGYKEVAEVRDLEKIPLILIVIDELADLMVTCAKEVEESIARLSAMARAAGIHLLVATQRPSVDVITGVIKANVPSRIAFAVSSQVDSRTIIDGAGAEKLLGRGDMLYRPVDQNKSLRAQGAFVSDAEVERVIEFLKKQNYKAFDSNLAQQIESATAATPNQKQNQEAEDELFDQAVEIALEANYASVSLFQRRLNIGYPRAARLVDALERAGFIGPFEGSKPRTLRITRAQWQASKLQEEESDEL